jgi:hypothetical protein
MWKTRESTHRRPAGHLLEQFVIPEVAHLRADRRRAGQLPDPVVVGEEGAQLIRQVGMPGQQGVAVGRRAGIYRLQVSGDDLLELPRVRMGLSVFARHGPLHFLQPPAQRAQAAL